MADIIQHTTTEGERWDNIAEKIYGSASMMNRILEANPTVPRYDVLPGGIVLDIPIIATVDVKIDAEKLPPWKR